MKMLSKPGYIGIKMQSAQVLLSLFSFLLHGTYLIESSEIIFVIQRKQDNFKRVKESRLSLRNISRPAICCHK